MENLIVFDPYHGGHHAEYIVHLLNELTDRGGSGKVLLACPADLLHDIETISPGVLGELSIRLNHAELPALNPLLSPARLAIANRRLLREVVADAPYDQLLAMYLDHLQFALAAPAPRSRRGDITISGILFRPNLHLPLPTSASIRERLTQWRKKFLLQRMAAHPQLGTVFSLDQLAVQTLKELDMRAVGLPDPIDPADNGPGQQAMRRRFGIDLERTLFVLFGMLDRRKGLLEVLAALRLLTPLEQRSTAVLLAGPIANEIKQLVRTETAWLTANSEVQCVVHDQLIPVSEAQSFISAADIVSAAYVGHVGSSAVLVRAAAAGRPVLCAASGNMGILARAHSLGITVEAHRPSEIANGIRCFLQNRSAGFEATVARSWAARNTPVSFARMILDNLSFPAAQEGVGTAS